MEKCSKSVEKEEETQQSAQLLEVYANDGRERESSKKDSLFPLGRKVVSKRKRRGFALHLELANCFVTQ